MEEKYVPFANKFPYLKVVVELEKNNIPFGDVVTAFTVKTITGGIKGEPIYESDEKD